MVYLLEFSNWETISRMANNGARLYEYDAQSLRQLLRSTEWKSGIRKQKTAKKLSLFLGINIEANKTPIRLKQDDLLIYLIYIREMLPPSSPWASKFIMAHIHELTPALKETVL